MPEANQKTLDSDRLHQLIYIERPPCPHALARAVQTRFEGCLRGGLDDQAVIALCLNAAINSNGDGSLQKFMFIACTGRLPFVS
jgi:hypothetical protein